MVVHSTGGTSFFLSKIVDVRNKKKPVSSERTVREPAGDHGQALLGPVLWSSVTTALIKQIKAALSSECNHWRLAIGMAIKIEQ
jgi:hypothetical protein